MSRLGNFLTDSRTLAIVGLIALVVFIFLFANTLGIAVFWVGAALVMGLAVSGVMWLFYRQQARSASAKLGEIIGQQDEAATRDLPADRRAEIETLRGRLLEAVKTIKGSRLGQVSGSTALYQLPWYMIIGNPAAGKSTAVVNSGLQFPFADQHGGAVVHGIGGTRNCDWFFTTEGILLDTAGRYSVHEEDRQEWFGFLDLLKRYRPRAPINGIIIGASIPELTGSRPDFAINLAKNLRQRVQELTERLEIFAPLYVVFTKADLIAGFADFFRDADGAERDRVWGATMPYDPAGTEDALSLFDQRFDELYEGLKEMSVAQMALNAGKPMPPGFITLPLEFAAIKPTLQAFIATLFEDNPYQFKPIFRGFYFTSALQEGPSVQVSSERVARRFGLKVGADKQAAASNQQGYFLLDLFRKVIFADRKLVKQYASPAKTRLRYASFFGAVLLLGLAFAGWAWSYVNNQQLISNVQADLDKAVKVQQNRLDLQSRIEAMGILQDRIEQLEHYQSDHPIGLGLGLYQGQDLLDKLRTEYYAGLRQIMLKPVAESLESFLGAVNANAAKLQPMERPPESGAASHAPPAQPHGDTPYAEATPTNVEDAYNALKTYLMLADKSHVDINHLYDQLTRFWRGWLEANRDAMPREEMIRSAERIIGFYLSHVNDPQWPRIEDNLSLVEQTRDNLSRVVRGMPAIDRVYAEIKSRASTRFPPITVAQIIGDQDKNLIAGSYAIPGTFSRDAWEQYVEGAIRDAAEKELQSADWVLNTASRDDLTLEGSPEHIEKALTGMYKADYVREWQKFVQGIAVEDFASFDDAVNGMDRLGDQQNSPISKVLNELYRQTSWDNPSLVGKGLQGARQGFLQWFRQKILRQSSGKTGLDAASDALKDGDAVGPIGKEFAGVARLMVVHDQRLLLSGYLDALSKIRTRLGQIRNQGDPGPGARSLMQQTLEGNGSELADALKYVEEQMLTGMTDPQRDALRPLLVRPLLQTYAAIIKPAEGEVNKIWTAQALQPFQASLAGKYPFTANATVEATPGEIAQVFGPEGAIAKFVDTSLGPLVVRRGDVLNPRTWADIGISLNPDFVSGLPQWIAPLGTNGAAGGSAGSGTGQTVFQIEPLPAPGTTEYSVVIDGQELRYRNTPAQWSNFVWPSTQGEPGARVTATTFDGRSIELANYPGRYGLERLINTAKRERKDGGMFQLSWTSGSVTVAIDLRILSSPQAAGASSPQSQGLRGLKLPAVVTGSAPAAVATAAK